MLIALKHVKKKHGEAPEKNLQIIKPWSMNYNIYFVQWKAIDNNYICRLRLMMPQSNPLYVSFEFFAVITTLVNIIRRDNFPYVLIFQLISAVVKLILPKGK